MNGLFSKLDDESYFSEFIRNGFSNAPKEITVLMNCEHVLDDARISYAHGEYKQNIEKFSVLLHSSNPDHYKRAGALLHSLYPTKIVSEYKPDFSCDDVETGLSMIPHTESQDIAPFLRFYEEYHNQMLSFNLAYRICAAYEACPVEYDFDYLHNVCHFMKQNSNLSLDTFFMIFKSLMQQNH